MTMSAALKIEVPASAPVRVAANDWKEFKAIRLMQDCPSRSGAAAPCPSALS
jgi:hypothetical protein